MYAGILVHRGRAPFEIFGALIKRSAASEDENANVNKLQNDPVNKLQNDPFTISSSVLWTHLRPETRVATSRVSGHKETKCQCWSLERQKNNNKGDRAKPA